MNDTDCRFRALAARRLMLAAFVTSVPLLAADLGLKHYGIPTDEFIYHEATKWHMDWLAHVGQPGSFSEEKLRSEYVIVYGRRGWMLPLEVEMMQRPETAIWTLQRDGVALIAHVSSAGKFATRLIARWPRTSPGTRPSK